MKGTQPMPKPQALKLVLYVAGESPNSVAALQHLRAVLADHPAVAAGLEVVDILRHPDVASRENVLVTPMLIRLTPTPARRIVGSLKDRGALLSVLGLAEPHRG
jgi:circadian clock protein KaiB